MRPFIPSLLAAGIVWCGSMPEAFAASTMVWPIRPELTCDGLVSTREGCQQLRAHIGGPWATRQWLMRPTIRQEGRRLRGALARKIETQRAPAPLLGDYAVALLLEGRAAEAIAYFLMAMRAEPQWATAAQGAIVAFAALWPVLDNAQRRDGAMALAGALGERSHRGHAVKGRAYLLTAQLYRLAGETARARTVLQAALRQRPDDRDLRAALAAIPVDEQELKAVAVAKRAEVRRPASVPEAAHSREP